MRAQNVAVIMLMTFAYDVPASQLADVPEWVKSDRFDVTFTPDREETSLASTERETPDPPGCGATSSGATSSERDAHDVS
jgi:hypothetical protein